MRALFIVLVITATACGTPPGVSAAVTDSGSVDVDAGVDAGANDAGSVADSGTISDAGVSLDGGVLPARFVRPMYFSTADQAMPGSALTALDSLWAAMNARFREETGMTFELAPAIQHASPKTCAQLGTTANEMINNIRLELAPDGNTKFQIMIPCDDPSAQAAGIAYIGGPIAITFDGTHRLGTATNQAYLTTVAMHELGHNLWLQHNSVGNNCMGPVELRSFALGLLGDTTTAACVFLPHQRTVMIQGAPDWLVLEQPATFTASAPAVTATASKLSGSWEVLLSWLGALPSGAVGWHVERNGARILRVKTSSDTDSDGAMEYHSDPAMTDPGLVDGGHYCYRLRAYDAAGNDGPLGAEKCVDL